MPEAGTDVKGTVVMVPGFTGSREDFLPMAPFVTAEGYRLISYSQLGQYDSDGPDGPEAVGEYRGLFVTPTVKAGASALSLGHPVKDRTRQGERHGFGAVVCGRCARP